MALRAPLCRLRLPRSGRAPLPAAPLSAALLRGFASGRAVRSAETTTTTTSPAGGGDGGDGAAKKVPASSAVDGTVLKGLNIYKEGKDPVALKDEEYPAWLWTLLDETPADSLGERERQRVERSKAIKEANFMKSRK